MIEKLFRYTAAHQNHVTKFVSILYTYTNKQLFFILSLSIDITEECSDVGDDSDDEDFEPSLNFTLKVCHINYVSPSNEGRHIVLV